MVEAGIGDILIVTREECGGFSAPARQRQRIRVETHQLRLSGRRRGNRGSPVARRVFLRTTTRFASSCGDNIVERSDLALCGKISSAGIRSPDTFKGSAGSPAIRRPEIRGDQIVRIDEKPESCLQIRGYGHYMYDAEVFEIIKTLKTFEAGELEITDVNNSYISRAGCITTFWMAGGTDAGTFESLLHASNLVCRNSTDRRGRKAGSLDERAEL